MYDAKERELILQVMDLFIGSPELARKLDFEVLNELFPDLVSVFDFMQSEDYKNKTELHSIVDNLNDKGLRRILSLARGYND